MKKKVSVSWSGGKDSAFALYTALQDPSLEVLNLHTSLNDKLKRVGMHGTPEALIEMQAERTGLSLYKIYIPADTSNQQYEAAMLTFYQQQKAAGIEAVVFGDIYLGDLRVYREQLLEKAGLEAIFPLWQKDTSRLIREFLDLNFKTCICAADAKFFGEEAAGRVLDQAFIDSLPAEVDPCGERGEFHSFVFEGPVFIGAVPYRKGETVYKSYSFGAGAEEKAGFWFADLETVTEKE